MKKITIYLLATCLSLICLPFLSNAATVNPVTDSARASTLLVRLYEINAMDKSNLTSSEKKELRKEVKSLNTELKRTSNGVYLSVGAVIIIVLLLILLV